METFSIESLMAQSKNNLFEFQKDLLVKEIDYIHAQISHYDDFVTQ